MPRILLVKTSSLGDVVHNLPVATDIRRHFPEAAIDWVVEEAYGPLVGLHPAVRRVIPVAWRRWRQRLLGRCTWQDIAAFRRACRAETYDAVIDTQGLLKSALISRAARGRRHGFDASSAREPLAARLYDVVHSVRRDQHAVNRNRQLAAASLGYPLAEPLDYGVTATGAPGQGYCVLLHATSRADKLWPVQHWIALGRRLEARGLVCVLPYGSEQERGRSEQISHGLRQASIPPFLAVGALVTLLSGARAVIGVDTGLVHLAAALGRPVVAVFAASDPALTGVLGGQRSRNLGRPGLAPEPEAVMNALAEFEIF